MIELLQHPISNQELYGQIKKQNPITVNIDTDMVKKRIQEFKNRLSQTKQKKNKINLKQLIKYLENILEQTKDTDKLEYRWVVNPDTNMIEQTPIKFIYEPLYNLNTCNFIKLGTSQKLIELDTKNLADIISFSYIYKDLGESHQTVEKLLYNLGIISIEDSNILLDYFKKLQDDMYELSKEMLVGDTPYKSLETKKISDYFYSAEFRTQSYNKVVDYSATYANTVIANSIMRQLIRNRKNINIVMITPINITFIADARIDITTESLDDIIIRVFGRRFLVKPKINIL